MTGATVEWIRRTREADDLNHAHGGRIHGNSVSIQQPHTEDPP